MISLLISLIVLCLVIGVVFWLLTLLPIPQPFLNIVKVCIVLIFLLYAISMLTGITHPFYLYR